MWVLSLVAAIVISISAVPGQRLTWVGIAFAGAVIATFVIQLAIQRKDGFVVRTMASIGGAMIVLAVATIGFGLVVP